MMLRVQLAVCIHHVIHCLHTATEHIVDKLVEMTLDAVPKPETAHTDPTPLVGTATTEDSDSDSEPAVDIDEYTGEDDDPVCSLSFSSSSPSPPSSPFPLSPLMCV